MQPKIPKMRPQDERIPGNFEPMLSFYESAVLQAQIAGMILAAKNSRCDYQAWTSSLIYNEHGMVVGDEKSAERCEDSVEQARELMTQMGLFRAIPDVEYGKKYAKK